MGSVCLLLEGCLLPAAGKGGLEAVVDTESEVVAVQVEAETVIAEGRVVVVSVAVAEEAAVSHEVNILGQVHADTGLDTYLPAGHGITCILHLVSVDAESTVEEEAYSTELGVGVTGIGIYGEGVLFNAFAVVVRVTESDTEIPAFVEVVANFWLDGEGGVVVVSVAPETGFTTYVNLCRSTDAREGYQKGEYKLLHFQIKWFS